MELWWKQNFFFNWLTKINKTSWSFTHKITNTIF